MTTVIGLANSDLKFAYLVADRQGTFAGQDGSPVTKDLQVRKLYPSDDGNFVVGISGVLNDDTRGLISKLTSGDIDAQKIINKGKFAQLRSLNHRMMGNHVPNMENTSSLLIATRFEGTPKLYTCFPLGAVEQRGMTWIGSGSPMVHQYVEAANVVQQSRDYLPQGETTREGMIRFGLEALRYAQGKDIYSSGLDMIAVSPEGLTDHFGDLTENFSSKLKRIQKAYKQPKKE